MDKDKEPKGVDLRNESGWNIVCDLFLVKSINKANVFVHGNVHLHIMMMGMKIPWRMVLSTLLGFYVLFLYISFCISIDIYLFIYIHIIAEFILPLNTIKSSGGSW